MDNLQFTTKSDVTFKVSKEDGGAERSPDYIMLQIATADEELGYALTHEECRMLSMFLERIAIR